MSTMKFWNQKSFCLVTGASKGIGRTIAIEFSKHVAPGSLFLLVARSLNALEETKLSILKATDGKCSVQVAAIDLGKPDAQVYFNTINEALFQANQQPSDFDHSILVHNAGSLGIRKDKPNVIDRDDIDEIQNYYAFNLFSLIVLNSQFFKIFSDESKQRSIIQISSLGAVEPFKTWGMYCSGKAARDMLMRSINLESNIQTLSWAPGPCQTDIYDEAVDCTGDKALAQEFDENRKQGKILTCEQTVYKLIRVLGQKKFTKGEHVDYYDVD